MPHQHENAINAINPSSLSPRRYQTGKHLEAFLTLLIWEQPSHGGALMQRLQILLPDRWTIDSGRVYRTLRELESRGILTSSWVVEDAGAPLRIYRLTATGEQHLVEWKDEIQVRRNSLNNFLDRYRACLNRGPMPTIPSSNR